MTRMCEFCKREAVYDAKLKAGPWAYVCAKHFLSEAVAKKGLFSELSKID